MTLYYRPIAQTDPCRPAGALTLAGGWCWFTHVEVLTRAGSQGLIAAADLPEDVRGRLTAPRAPLAGVSFERPSVMGILNVTPDSFSDGGRFDAPEAALTQAQALAQAGADMLDIGGESTRPGAVEVPVADEISRTAPVIAALRAQGYGAPISIDTRKAPVAKAAVEAGAGLVNDVSAMLFDADMAATVAATGAALSLMHAQGTPATMQAAPSYDDVLLDVYDHLAARLAVAEAAGIARARIMLDPGIGFGKTLEHNLVLLRRLSLFHALGCPILLGVSRKRFIGTIGGAEAADARAPGTLAVTLAGLAQGAQMHRVHDVAEIAQGIRLYNAITKGYEQ
ncbi:dihydropteroate synthase [Rhodobacter aestuarii]|uniref:Dihydropteroate synthase n=1 Tax=Rhodobacter aestuarii TaxID=453582 RepID=A0A1N7L3D7_9RHOB|nr:dihydropteroate synthase [Rhodobacter aestuarii]PTV95405.1 dihydropteroate synthase [Rhodobacter aestuarii]SIS68343.1 Dihydropteroate synthase [Rhodobacter aestuarii]